MIKNEILFSIIIPAKNEEWYIGKCLDGVNRLSLNDHQVEVIVVDNGSTDRTLEIAKNKGALVLSVTGGTIGLLRNQGAKIAKGAYLAFLDADCIPGKNWLNNTLEHFKNSRIASVGSKPQIPESGTTWVERTWALIKQKPEVSDVKWLSSCNIVMRKSVFDSVAGFDETLPTCEDADLGFKISANYRIINDPGVSVIHLREPKTLKEFFKKEIWHGSDNYRGVLRHGIVIQEMPSVLMPLWVLVWSGAFIISSLTLALNIALLSLLASLIPAVIQSLRALKNKKPVAMFFQIFILYTFYYLARGLSIFQIR